MKGFKWQVNFKLYSESFFFKQRKDMTCRKLGKITAAEERMESKGN